MFCPGYGYVLGKMFLNLIGHSLRCHGEPKLMGEL